MKKTLLLLFLVVSGFAMHVHAQTGDDKAKLEEEQKSLQKEIKELEGLYSKVKNQKKQSLGQLTLIQRKIDLQNQYLGSIGRQIRSITDDIYFSNNEIYRLKKQLDTLKQQYAKSIVYAYKNRGTFNFLNFIFSATGFNDALKRIAYLRSYRNYREQQVKNIEETKRQIENKKEEMIGKREKQNMALNNQVEQKKVLEENKDEQSVVVSKIKSQESEISKKLSARRAKDKQLKSAIAAVIRREIEIAKAEAKKRADADAAARKKAEEDAAKLAPKENVAGSDVKKTDIPVVKAAPKESTKNESVLEFSARDAKLGADFFTSKGSLPWPVDNGFVSMGYGNNDIGGVVFPNPGLTISTPKIGANVKAVFDGEVARVFKLADVQAITIRHGKYFTTYSNLSSVNVKNGDMVKTGQIIGKAAADDDGDGGMIDFLLMIESTNVNPKVWLR